MSSRNTISIGEAVSLFLRENNLEQGLQERHVDEYWKVAVGNMVMPYTKSIELRNSILYVKITNAALRNELFIRRYDIVKRINEQAGHRIVNELHLT